MYGIHFLQWHGWQEEEWRYWWLSLGFTYESVVIFPPLFETVISKKFANVWDHPALNFMVACFSFNCSINSLSFSSPCSQRRKIPSMYLHHRYGFSSISLELFFSNSAINNMSMLTMSISLANNVNNVNNECKRCQYWFLYVGSTKRLIESLERNMLRKI